MRGSPGGDGEDLGGDQEGGTVGPLLEEGRQKVDGLESVNVGRGLKGVEQNGGEEEEDKVGDESDNLESLPADKLVVDEQGRGVVPAKPDTTVEQVPVPTDNDRVVTGADDLDERRLEELVSVESEIVGKPSKGRGKDSTSKVGKDELERLDVVSGLVDPGVLLAPHQGRARVLHLVITVVGQPEGGQGHDPELDPERPLSRDGRVRGVTGSVVETQEEDDEDGLVEELTPTLHEKGEDDVSTSVELVIPAVDGSTASLGLVLEGRRRRHGVPVKSRRRVSGPGLYHQGFHKTARHSLSTDSDTVDEQTPSIHDRPPAQRRPPHGSQHDQPEEHDQRVLNQTEFTADPVSLEPDGDLADHDTDDLEVGLLRVVVLSVLSVLSRTRLRKRLDDLQQRSSSCHMFYACSSSRARRP